MKRISAMPAYAGCSARDEELEKQWQEDHAVCDAEWKEWLSQYDDDGYLKQGIFGTAAYIPNHAYSFLAMPEEERAAFVISEKKRMGLL